ncbi:hypothetical protein [Amycolatopsis sp. NPDC021455]|uniref:hypothetical protein n=1 Tax=Amycolatopsis sp. NPDC021455 TaxID=3154901 RepID=UPI0033D79F67
MRRSTRPLVTRAVKTLLAMTLLVAGFGVAAPAVASAAPANTAVTAAAAPMAGSLSAAPRTAASAVFTCNYFSRSPFVVVDFTCQVTSGAIRVYIICFNGSRYNSAPLPAVGTYNVRLSCPVGRVNLLGWESLT